jgi:serine/threonine protein kinase
MAHYQIGPRIGTGGMAEVYLGTHQGIGGFRKLVVLKRLLGWQRSDGEAIENLLDEARIAATMNHPNIVSTLDIGLEAGSPYVVLEYLSGEDLRYLLQELHGRDDNFPLAMVCRIGASIAAALSQAHDLVLPDGARRCIVHRDVTPSNIIVCYGGITKLVDFGVARVVDDVPKTKSGVVKGKFSYLAPEQLTGAPLDGRTDIFQLGIVLWEMCTIQRLFEGKTDAERINAVLNRVVCRPSEINPSVPSCLDRTILKALDRDPARRHQTAQELEGELLEALAAIGASGGDHSVAKWMQSAFAARHAWRLDLERRAIAAAETESQLDSEDADIRVESDAAASPWSRLEIATGPTLSGHGSFKSGSSLRGVAVEGTVAPRPRSRAPWAVLALVVMAAAFWGVRSYTDVFDTRDDTTAAAATPAPAPPADYEVDIRATPANASIAIDGVPIANGRYRASFASDGAVHTVTLTAPDHTTVQRRFHGATMIEVNLEPLATSPARSEDVAPVETAANTSDARSKRRTRPHATAIRDAALPTTTTTSTPTPPKSDGSGSAPAQPRPKDDSFTPSTDNIDPFKTGN